MAHFAVPGERSRLSWTSSEPQTPSSWRSLFGARKGPKSTPSTGYNSPGRNVSIESPTRAKSSNWLGSSHSQLKQPTAKLSWYSPKSKATECHDLLIREEVGSTEKKNSSFKVHWKLPNQANTTLSKKRALRISPPIPARPKEHLFPRRLFASDPPDPGRRGGSKLGVSCDQITSSEGQHLRGKPPELADLDPDKKGNAFERIYPDGWNKILPKQWIEEAFSDDDSKDTEETRSVYSQDNGEDRIRLTGDARGSRRKTQQRVVEPVHWDIVPKASDELDTSMSFKDRLEVDERLTAIQHPTARTPIATISEEPLGSRALPHSNIPPITSTDKREAQRLRSFEHSKTTLRDVLLEQNTPSDLSPAPALSGQPCRRKPRYNCDGPPYFARFHPYGQDGDTDHRLYHWQHTLQSLVGYDSEETKGETNHTAEPWLDHDEHQLIPAPLRLQPREIRDTSGSARQMTKASTANRSTGGETEPAGSSISPTSSCTIHSLSTETSSIDLDPKNPDVAWHGVSHSPSKPVSPQLQQQPQPPPTCWDPVIHTTDLETETQTRNQTIRSTDAHVNYARCRASYQRGHQAYCCHVHEPDRIASTEVEQPQIVPYPYYDGSQPLQADFETESGWSLDFSHDLDLNYGNTSTFRPRATRTFIPQSYHEGKAADQEVLTEINDILDMYLYQSGQDQDHEQDTMRKYEPEDEDQHELEHGHEYEHGHVQDYQRHCFHDDVPPTKHQLHQYTVENQSDSSAGFSHDRGPICPIPPLRGRRRCISRTSDSHAVQHNNRRVDSEENLSLRLPSYTVPTKTNNMNHPEHRWTSGSGSSSNEIRPISPIINLNLNLNLPPQRHRHRHHHRSPPRSRSRSAKHPRSDMATTTTTTLTTNNADGHGHGDGVAKSKIHIPIPNTDPSRACVPGLIGNDLYAHQPGRAKSSPAAPVKSNASPSPSPLPSPLPSPYSRTRTRGNTKVMNCVPVPLSIPVPGSASVSVVPLMIPVTVLDSNGQNWI